MSGLANQGVGAAAIVGATPPNVTNSSVTTGTAQDSSGSRSEGRQDDNRSLGSPITGNVDPITGLPIVIDSGLGFGANKTPSQSQIQIRRDASMRSGPPETENTNSRNEALGTLNQGQSMQRVTQESGSDVNTNQNQNQNQTPQQNASPNRNTQPAQNSSGTSNSSNTNTGGPSATGSGNSTGSGTSSGSGSSGTTGSSSSR